MRRSNTFYARLQVKHVHAMAGFRHRHCCLLGGLLLLVVATGGCGDNAMPRVAVGGHVTLDGQPLDRGSIEFIPQGDTQGPKAAGEIIDGKYSLARRNGPVVGRVRIEIHAVKQPDFPLDDPRAYAAHYRRGDGAAETDRIPVQYNRDSKLIKTTSAGGANTFDFDLVTPAETPNE